MPGVEENKSLPKADAEQMEKSLSNGKLVDGFNYTDRQIRAVALHSAINKNNRYTGLFKSVMCCFGRSASGEVLETNNEGADNECGSVVEMTV